MASPTTVLLNSVAIGCTEAWAVGNLGTILQWSGTAWTAAASPTQQDLMDVALDGPGSGWAVGKNGTVLRLSGGSWSLYSALSPAAHLLTVSALSPSKAMIGANDGSYYVWDGASWTTSSYSYGGVHVFDEIALVSETKAFAAYGFVFYVWDGSSWALGNQGPTTGTISCETVWAHSRNDAWCVGRGGAEHLEFGGITTYFFDDFTPLPWPHAIGGTSNTDVVAAGDEGTLLHWDGSRWTRLMSPTPNHLRGIQTSPAGEMIVVGQGGVILRRR